MSSSIFSLILVLDWDGWLTSRPGRFTPGKETRYTLFRRLSGWGGRGNLARTGFRSVDFRARRDLLYRLLHPGPIVNEHKINILQMQRFSNIWENSNRL